MVTADQPAHTLIRCAGCGHVLAAEVAGLQVIRRGNPRGRPYEWVGLAHTIKCDQCGACWRNPAFPAAA